MALRAAMVFLGATAALTVKLVAMAAVAAPEARAVLPVLLAVRLGKGGLRALMATAVMAA